MRSIHAAHSALRRDETAAPSLYNHRVRPAHGRRCLRSKAVLWLAQKLLHQIDTLVRHFRPGREPEGLLPVEDLLPSDMPLVCVNIMMRSRGKPVREEL